MVNTYTEVQSRLGDFVILGFHDLFLSGMVRVCSVMGPACCNVLHAFCHRCRWFVSLPNRSKRSRRAVKGQLMVLWGWVSGGPGGTTQNCPDELGETAPSGTLQ